MSSFLVGRLYQADIFSGGLSSVPSPLEDTSRTNELCELREPECSKAEGYGEGCSVRDSE